MHLISTDFVQYLHGVGIGFKRALRWDTVVRMVDISATGHADGHFLPQFCFNGLRSVLEILFGDVAEEGDLSKIDLLINDIVKKDISAFLHLIFGIIISEAH